jgi:hypothetical protein
VRAGPELLLDLLGRSLAEGETIRTQSAELTQAVPVERRADAVLTIERDGEVTAGFVLEVQLAVDPGKRFTWPLDEAERAPALAVLSAILHSREPDATSMLQATVRALAALDPDTRARYAPLLRTLFHGTADAIPFEAFMDQAERWAFIQEEVRKADLAHGERVAKRQLSRELLLGILGDRGLGPSEETRARVEAETDIETLKRWARRAATAPTEEAVFASS